MFQENVGSLISYQVCSYVSTYFFQALSVLLPKLPLGYSVYEIACTLLFLMCMPPEAHRTSVLGVLPG